MTTTTIDGHLVADFYLRRPIELILEQDEDGWWIASDGISVLWGYASTRDEAVEDYKLTLADVYEFHEALPDTDPVRELVERRDHQ